MEAEYLGGNADRARASFTTARARLTSLEDRVTLYAAWIALESSHSRFADAIAAGVEILRDLGAAPPTKMSMVHVLRQYAANRLAQRGRSIDDLAGLATLRDPGREAAMKIMMALAPAAYCSDTNLLTWIMLRIAGVSMRHGVCDVSSYGFAGYGMVLAAAFGKYDEAAGFGRLALGLNERFKNGSLAGKLHFINGSYIVAWTRPIAEAQEELLRAQAETLRAGDRAYETYTSLLQSALAFCETVPLESLQAIGEAGRELSAQRSEADLAGANSALARYAASLRGLTPGLLDFGIEGSSDAAFRASLTNEKILTRFFYTYCRAEIAYLARDTERAHALLAEAAKVGSKAIFGMLFTVEVAWLEALVAARRFDHALRRARPGLLLAVAMRVKKLASLAESHPASFETLHLLARGELQRIAGRAEKARATFERAAQSARSRGSAKREAIALDLAAHAARQAGDALSAQALEDEARGAYRRWGATGLVDRPR